MTMHVYVGCMEGLLPSVSLPSRSIMTRKSSRTSDAGRVCVRDRYMVVFEKIDERITSNLLRNSEYGN